jgi:hypothetical protein
MKTTSSQMNKYPNSAPYTISIYTYTNCEQYIAFKMEHLNEIKVAAQSVNYRITFQKMDSQYVIVNQIKPL